MNEWIHRWMDIRMDEWMSDGLISSFGDMMCILSFAIMTCGLSLIDAKYLFNYVV